VPSGLQTVPPPLQLFAAPTIVWDIARSLFGSAAPRAPAWIQSRLLNLRTETGAQSRRWLPKDKIGDSGCDSIRAIPHSVTLKKPSLGTVLGISLRVTQNLVLAWLRFTVFQGRGLAA